MKHWRLIINRDTKRATVELKQDVPWKPWRFMGTVSSEKAAERMIRDGWPDQDGCAVFTPTIVFTLEVIR